LIVFNKLNKFVLEYFFKNLTLVGISTKSKVKLKVWNKKFFIITINIQNIHYIKLDTILS